MREVEVNEIAHCQVHAVIDRGAYGHEQSECRPQINIQNFESIPPAPSFLPLCLLESSPRFVNTANPPPDHISITIPHP